MKTALKTATEKLFDYLDVQFPATTGHIALRKLVAEIKLDAMKEGMRRAACQRSNLMEGGGEYIQGYNHALKDYEHAIFTAAEQLTMEDL